jgi:hypothetical protein
MEDSVIVIRITAGISWLVVGQKRLTQSLQHFDAVELHNISQEEMNQIQTKEKKMLVKVGLEPTISGIQLGTKLDRLARPHLCSCVGPY